MQIPDQLTCLLRNLYAGQEVTVRTGHGTTDWFQIGKGVHQGCILPGANTRDPTHDKVMRRKPDRQGRSGFQGFRKAPPGAHLKDDIYLSDACFNRLLPNFCDTGRRPSPISFQIRINLEL